MPGRPHETGSIAPSENSLRHPRVERLKRRCLIRRLFQRGAGDVVRSTVGPIVLAARIVDTSQLPSGGRVQVGVAARRGSRGVQRNRVRRLLREAARTSALPKLRAFVKRELAAHVGLSIMVVDRRRSDNRLSLRDLQASVSLATERLIDALGGSEPAIHP